MLDHFVIILLLSSVGIQCLVAKSCARLSMNGVDASNYPQLAGVYVLQTTSPLETLNDFPVYQHELGDVFLYYNTSEAALMIGPNQSHGLLRLDKKPGVEILSNVNYSMDHLFDFSSWKQWDLLHSKFTEGRSDSVLKPVCVDQNFGLCTSGILRPSVGSVGVNDLNVFGPTMNTTLSISVSRIYFKLYLGQFRDVRPQYEMKSDVIVTPYYLYHQNGKWKVSTVIRHGTEVLEMESNAMRVEYERQSEWYVIGSDGRRQSSAIRHLECSRQSAADVNCQSASTEVCRNGGSCHIDSAGVSACICTPDYRGVHCEKPVAKCKQPVSLDSPVFALSDREGSIMSIFCPLGRVVFSVCDGSIWWPDGCQASLDTSSAMPGNTSTALPHSRGRDPAAKIALVIASLIGVQLVLPFICYCCISCCKFDENKLISEERVQGRKRLTKFLRACSGFFYLSWWAWVAYLIYYLCVWHGCVPLDGTTIWSAVAIMAIICVCLLYVVVLCESICSHEYEYLTKVRDVMAAEEQITRMKTEPATIKFKADCWHPETRTRTIHDGSGQDGNGMHTEMCTIHVPTAAVEEMFSYIDCLDVSGNFLLPTSSATVTQVHVELAVEFADDRSQCLYNDAFELFKTSNAGRDQHVDFTVEYDLPSYAKELAIRDPSRQWLSSKHFVLASLFCFTWPYRWILNSSKNEYHYRIVKKVTVSPTDFQLPVPIGHPADIDIANGEEHPLLAVVPSIPVPLTPPPPYEE